MLNRLKTHCSYLKKIQHTSDDKIDEIFILSTINKYKQLYELSI